MTDLADGDWLFLLAHPDDDALIAGSIRELVRRGQRVQLAWVTDSSSLFLDQVTQHGIASSNSRRPLVSIRLRRQAECRGVAHVLGVPQENLHFLDLPSLEMVPQLAAGAEQMTRFLSDLRPTHLMTVAFEAGHIDHDCLNFLTYEARFRAGLDAPIFEFPLYTGQGGGFHVNRFFGPHLRQALSPEALERKRLTMQLYASQWPYMWVAGWVTGRRCWEPYRLAPPERDHRIPPHAGSLNIDRIYNRFMRYRFADFARQVDKVRTYP